MWSCSESQYLAGRVGGSWIDLQARRLVGDNQIKAGGQQVWAGGAASKQAGQGASMKAGEGRDQT
eukprot:329026-Chlamydomonas_euryale.AAC.1